MDHLVREEIRRFLMEDLGYGDITSQAVCGDKKMKANILAKEDFLLSGVHEAGIVFDEMDVSWKSDYKAGQWIREGTVIMEVKGLAKNVLAAERLALNILMRMSGIATEVNKMVKLSGKARVAATRKTTPGFRYFEKKAVVEGGGDPHRYRLDDMILVKDNHIWVAGNLEEAITMVKRSSIYKKIEVEVESYEQAIKAAEMGVDIIMLDNFTPSQTKSAYETIKDIDPHIMVEISGNITRENIADYAPYADVISCGFITHSVKAVDMSMKVIE